jgi:hypothetical protein
MITISTGDNMTKEIHETIKSLGKQGYSKVSLHELIYHCKKQKNLNFDPHQLAKAVTILGYTIEDGTIVISSQPVARHFHKLPQTKMSKVLKHERK